VKKVRNPAIVLILPQKFNTALITRENNSESGDDSYMSALENIDPNWRKKYKSLAEFYAKEYDPEYFSFSKYELEIDPMETFEEIKAYDPLRQQKEIMKCAISFPYFCHKYVKIAHPKRGLLPFILYNYQRRVVQDYEKHRFNILSKFRQGGLTTVTVLWCMWRCMFKLDETIMVLSKSDREAIAAGEIVKRALIELPAWLRPEMDKNNDHQKLFTETGCKLFFYTPEAARGRSITYLVLDEAAFIPQMEKHWKAMFPTISTGGHCITISTVNGVGNWYYDIFMGAKKGENDFHVIELDYWEHPEYNDPDWVKQTRAQLGEKGWMQEVMRDFLGAGDSYIPPEIINDLDVVTRDIEPIRMLFPQWNNLDEAREQRVTDMETWVRGALHIWREPVDGRDYIIGVDAAGGMGNENDNSCIEVIDAVTCEQVAEFYSNIIPVYNFAQVVAMLGKTYNNALIIVEDEKYGGSVLEKLQHEFFYDNLFESTQGSSKNPKVGVKTTLSTRPKFLENIQTRLINRSIAIRSKRFVKELKGFIWNRETKRAEATKGFHDDAIMAMALALFAREQRYRNVPVGLVEDQEKFTETFKSEIYDEIKKELAKNAPDDWIDPDEADMLGNINHEDRIPFILSNYKRPHDALLKEFGW
jgi:phage FluMu gp28-like protein